ncbi:SAM-dependent methyltransferase [Mycobacterium hodleri]|uniref:SAM-dependent methyltransferase n=1 Tax=Mycolicibacterium hodleri TaxID=49897 RepID=A0A502DSY8_9MYCO|nr:SAM-dependent methyltransferase [Mycolicibacterium hodleri]
MTPSTILARELGELCRELGAVPGVDPALARRLRQARDLASGLDPYLDQCTSPESTALAELARRTRETDWASTSGGGIHLEQEMLSGHVEGQTLKFLVHLAGATRVLEIGMFTGYSALAMAEELPDGGVLVACEIDPAVAGFARECFDASPAGQKIAIEVGPAIDTLRRLAREGLEFDFVFIDADKPGYLDYVEFLLGSTLLSPRAVIAVDNTLLQGEPYADVDISRNGAAIAGFNAALTYDQRVEQVLIPLRDGLTLIRRTQG